MIRRHSEIPKLYSVDDTVDRLPPKFTTPELSEIRDAWPPEQWGELLRAYILDVTDWLRADQNKTERDIVNPSAVDVLEAIGEPPSKWFEDAMRQPTH